MVISQSKEQEADTNIWKLAILGLLGVLSAFLASYYVNEFFITIDSHFLLLGFLFSSFVIIFSVLNAFFVKNKWLLFSITVFESIIFFFSFFRMGGSHPSVFFMAALVLFLYFVIQGTEGARKALVNSVHIRFFQVARIVSSKTITAFLIFLSLITYVYYIEQGNLNDKAGKIFTNYFLDSARPVIELEIPGISFDGSVHDFIRTLTNHALQKSRISIADPTGGKKTFELNFSDLPNQQKEALIETTSRNIRESMEKSVGPLNEKESVRDAVYNIIKRFVGGFSEKTKEWMGIGFMVLFFFTLKGLSFIWLALIEFISFLAYKLLIVLKFGTVSSETRVREFVTLP